MLLDVGNKAVGIMKPGQTFTIEPMINAGKSTYDTGTFQRFNCTVQECFSFPDST
jgi:methionine aminopeptidase